MQRYFVSPQAIRDQQVRITGDDVKHITRVLRLQPGDEVICADGRGNSYLVRLTNLQPDAVVGDMIRKLDEKVESQVNLTLVQGLPKSDKMDLIVQKGTEMGIQRFVPIETERTIVQYDAKKETKRLERWQRIAKEAAEQSHRLVIPELQEVTSFRAWMEREARAYDLLLIAYEAEAEQGMREVLQRYSVDSPHRVIPRSIAVVIGPEGGLTKEEVDFALKKGARAVTLGPRILRTETAGLVAAAIILYHYGQMGG